MYDTAWLSDRMCRLAQGSPDLITMLEDKGYGTPARIMREAHRELAQDPADYRELERYWMEYAKERLAALKGPLDILKGVLPSSSTYRSAYLDALRSADRPIRTEDDGAIDSPQIQPLIRQYVELMPDHQIRKRVKAAIRDAQKKAIAEFGLEERSGYRALAGEKKYHLLLDRYQANLGLEEFKCERSTRMGTVFRRALGKDWAFALIDHSRDRVEGGRLSISFALSLPGATISAEAPAVNAAATFSPADLVPGFEAVCWFDSQSYAAMCLACDACSYLAVQLSLCLKELLIRPQQ